MKIRGTFVQALFICISPILAISSKKRTRNSKVDLILVNTYLCLLGVPPSFFSSFFLLFSGNFYIFFSSFSYFLSQGKVFKPFTFDFTQASSSPFENSTDFCSSPFRFFLSSSYISVFYESKKKIIFFLPPKICVLVQFWYDF